MTAGVNDWEAAAPGALGIGRQQSDCCMIGTPDCKILHCQPENLNLEYVAMTTKNLPLTALAGLSIITASSASAANFMIVSLDDNDPYISLLDSKFPNSTFDRQSFTDHTATATTDAIAAADVIIFARNTSSGEYTNGAGEIAFWNSVAKPLVLSNSYIARGGTGVNSRWGWLSNDTLNLAVSHVGSETTLNAAGADYFGLSEGAVDFHQGSNIDASGTSSSTTLGQGTLLGTLGSSNFVSIAHWIVGHTNANGTAFGGERLLFETAAPFNMTTAGQDALAGAIGRMIPEPSSSALLGLGLGLAVFRRKRG